MKKTTLRLTNKADKCVERLSRKLNCTRQDAILTAIEFLAGVFAAKPGATLETPDGTEFEVEFRV